jgi:tetratricopeptide (TPR) repeat protein
MFRNIFAVVLAIGLLATLYVYRFPSTVAEDDAAPPTSPVRQGLALVSAAGSDPQALKSAQEFFLATLSVDPKDPVALFGLGWASQLLNDAAEASRRYEQAESELREVLGFTLFNQSFLQEQSGDIERALESVLMAQEINPRFEAARSRAALLASKVDLPTESGEE